jgi:hypothetical protein
MTEGEVERQECIMPKEPSIHLLLDPASVKANQQGHITDAQRAQHEELGPGCVIPVCLFGMAFLGLSIFSFGALAKLILGALILLTPALIPLLVGGLFFGFVTGRIRDRQLSHELDTGEIAEMEGEVIMHDNGYRAQISGRPLSTISGSKTVQLPPGTYRFYYLPRARRILSAEHLNLDERGGPYASLLQALAQANGFTREDLTQNRLGLLSDGQQARVTGKRQDRERDLQGGRVEMVEGTVLRLDWSDTNNDTQAYEITGDNLTTLRFVVEGSVYDALIPGIRYRVYYLPHTKQLASMEPLP